MGRLGESFDLAELRREIAEELRQPSEAHAAREHQDTAEAIRILAESNYEVQFRPKMQKVGRLITAACDSAVEALRLLTCGPS